MLGIGLWIKSWWGRYVRLTWKFTWKCLLTEKYIHWINRE